LVDGSLPTRTEAIAITYVNPSGETTPSEISRSVRWKNTLTVVKSPTSLGNATGYNVYAETNGGASDYELTLQNSNPIPIGSDFAQQARGWDDTGEIAPFNPSPPVISYVLGGALPARSDVVRLTYVTPLGESAAGERANASGGRGYVATVVAPAAAHGALGYNVYASAAAGAAETLQNAAPVAFGTNYSEPSTGWTSNGRTPPISISEFLRSRPKLTYQQVPNVAPHTDYVKLTVVTRVGESGAGLESSNSLGSALTIVESPQNIVGALGYNVYAVRNNGGTGTGFVLQNSKPIPFGTSFVEDKEGWNVSGVGPPTFEQPAPSYQFVGQDTGYYDAEQPASSRAAIIFPPNDAPPDTILFSELTRGIPQSTSHEETIGGTILEKINFEVNNTVTFDGLPRFEFAPPGPDQSPEDWQEPYALHLFDLADRTSIETYIRFPFSGLTFVEDPNRKFVMRAGHHYEADLVSHSAFVISAKIKASPQVMSLPEINGVSIRAGIPGATELFQQAASDVTIAIGATPAVGTPILDTRVATKTLYVATFWVSSSARLNGNVDIIVTLPASLGSQSGAVRLAIYDGSVPEPSWLSGIRPTARDKNGNVVFRLKAKTPIGWQEYAAAVYISSDEKDVVGYRPDIAKKSPDIVVIGDSFSKLSVLKPYFVGCTPGWGPLPDCQYSTNPYTNWPGVLAAETHYKVWNLAYLGAQTTVSWYDGLSMLEEQVPKIPSSAPVVVVDGGIVDLGVAAGAPETSARMIQLADAIRARSPKCHIIFLSPHNYYADPKGVRAWERTDRYLAARLGGAYIDVSSKLPLAKTAFTPDGGELSELGAKAVADLIKPIVENWLRGRNRD
jgi:hypothetical protein